MIMVVVVMGWGGVTLLKILILPRELGWAAR